MVLFSGLVVVITFVGNRLLTQQVDPRPLGELYLFMNLAGWLTIPTASGYLYIVRHWQEAKAHALGHRFAIAIGKGLAAQGLLAAIGIVVLSAFPFGIGSLWTAIALFLICIGTATNQAFEAIQNMERRRISAGILQLLGNPMRSLALLAGGFILVSPSGQALLGVQAVHSLILGGATLLALGFALKQNVAGANPPSTPKSLTFPAFIAFASPALIGNILTQAATSAERWGLAKLEEPSLTAIFVLALGLSTAAVGAATGFLSTYFYPLITEAAVGSHRPLRDSIRQSKRYMGANVIVLTLTAGVVGFSAGRLTPILFGPKYTSVSEVLPWTIVGAALFQMGQTLYIYPFITRDMLGPVVAYSVSRIVYIVALLWRFNGSPVLHFGKLYACGQGLYVALMIGLSLWLFKKESRASGPPSTE